MMRAGRDFSCWLSARTAALWPVSVHRSNVAGVAVFVLVSSAFLLHARDYLPFFADDGFISLRYARRLLAGEGLTWNDGERVEGYSNLLWVLGCAAIGALGADLVDAARWLGQAAGLAAIAGLMAAHWPKSTGWKPALPALIAGIAFASSGPMAAWAVGGLEQPLVAACLAWGLFAVFRRLHLEQHDTQSFDARAWLLVGLPFALLAWTRPDAPLLACAVGFGLAACAGFKPPALRRVVWLLFLPALFVALQLLFRKIYYDAWIPNSGAAKLALTQERWTQGWYYVQAAIGPFRALCLLSCTALLPLIRDRHARRRLVVLATVAIAWLLYVVAIGGDIFPAWRHLVVPIMLACFATAEGMRWLVQRGPRTRYWATVGALALLAVYLFDQRNDPQNERARQERWEWDGRAIGSLFRRHFAPLDARLAADSAGSLPYHARLTTIDMLGINDRFIAMNPPPEFGRGALGHELGDGAYVLSRKPDLVVFGLPTGQREALYRSGIEMQRDPAFDRSYALITFEATGDRTVTSRVWVRTESERLGFVRGADRIFVPGFMLALGKAAAREDAQGRLGTMASVFAPAAIRIPRVPAGRWRITSTVAGTPVQMSVQVAGEAPTLAAPPLLVYVPGPGALDVKVALRPEATGLSHIRGLALERVRK